MKSVFGTIFFVISLVCFVTIPFVEVTPNTYTAWVEYQHDIVEVKVADWDTMKLLEIKNNGNVLFYNGTDFVKYTDPTSERCSIVRYENNHDGKDGTLNLLFGVLFLLIGAILFSKKDNLYDYRN